MTFDPRNILVIDFGQLGDVVMSLPALRAVREKFPRAQITVAVGKPAAEIIRMSGYADATMEVDRVALRDGFKPLSVLKVFQVAKDVRRRKFDFVIDLHSFAEPNLLGFFSGAPKRLFSRRRGRSLDFLANFKPRPPVEENNRERHQVDRYLDVLRPLDITDAERVPRLATRFDDDREIDRLLRKSKADAGAPLVGLFPGAGHESRRWPLQQFAQLADSLTRNDAVRPVVFAGPEERALITQMRSLFPSSTVILDRLTIRQLASAQARLAVFVSNDTGPVHIAAAVGVPIVLLLDGQAPDSYIPLSEPKRVICGARIAEIPVEEVYDATRALLAAGRVETLFAN
ncbi:MAG TPA: glycosyltransferase family 9 protein [Pyrinomonadaceae bacterium]|nr:glycosyltransferase family 9 protein [Pyrinomonadaceae bacterium]